MEAQPPEWEADLEKPSVAEAIAALPAEEVDVVGHRVVHGGDVYSETVVINDSVKSKIRKLETFAPLHNRLNLQGIDAAQKRFPSATHVAVFDTAFHSTIPEHAAAYPIPFEYFEKHGIKRYGFHGINHEYCTLRAASELGVQSAQVNLIICHLGNGCSITTVRNGKSIDNTMGFTPLEGLMMGTRSGSIDPGILLWMLRENNLEVNQVDYVLNRQSGLLGVSGISHDLREVTEAAQKDDHRAQLAIDMFVYRLMSYIGAAAAHLPRVDALVFSGGIGEHSEHIRKRAAQALSHIETLRVLVIEAREDWMIARECWRVT